MEKYLIKKGPAKRTKDDEKEVEEEEKTQTRVAKRLKPEKKPAQQASSSDAEAEEKAATTELFTNGQKEIDWNSDEPVPYSALCKTFEKIEGTTKRLAIQEFLSSFFTRVIENSPDNLLQTLYLCLNRVCPEYESLELGIGESTIIKAIAGATGRKVDSIKKDLAKLGDIGQVAKDSKKSQATLFSPKPLTVPGVFKKMKDIAQTSGQDSQNKKVGDIKALLTACSNGDEAKYLIRSLEGKLRIGLAEQTVLTSLAQTVVLRDSEFQKLSKAAKANELAKAPDILKTVYSELPSYDIIVPNILKYGIKGLQEHCKLTPGIPLKPMLAHPTKSISEVLDRLEKHKFICEFKYDGERGQIHRLQDGTVKIFSRNLEDNCQKYPDILQKLDKFIKLGVQSFVLDCEVVAWDRENKCIRPFQILSTRKRKDVKEEDIKVSVCLFAFDLLYLNGESLLHKSLSDRRKLLLESFREVEGELSFSRSIDATNVEDIQAFLDISVKSSCEGLMVKICEGEESTYEPSKRSRNWLKLKKDYLSGVGDSLDLVVIGAYLGRGKRTNVYGAFLLACYEPENEEYQTVCKIGTGFSDNVLEELYKNLKEREIQSPKKYYNYDKGTDPDVWFEPFQVWEVQTADLSISPIYKAAVGTCDPSKGISLRFPRFIRIREDKVPEQATSSEQIAEMYRRQFEDKNE